MKCKGFVDIVQELHNSDFISSKDKDTYFELEKMADCRKMLCDYKRTQSMTSNEISSRDQYF